MNRFSLLGLVALSTCVFASCVWEDGDDDRWHRYGWGYPGSAPLCRSDRDCYPGTICLPDGFCEVVRDGGKGATGSAGAPGSSSTTTGAAGTTTGAAGATTGAAGSTTGPSGSDEGGNPSTDGGVRGGAGGAAAGGSATGGSATGGGTTGGSTTGGTAGTSGGAACMTNN